MTKRVLLCADGQSLANPTLLGLDDERLDSISWLACVSSAESCRRTAHATSSLEELWVVSCDDMDPINVAAALKRDDPEKRVYLVSFGNNGSLASRAAAAKLDGVLNELLFVKRYEQVKRACGIQGKTLSLQSDEEFSGQGAKGAKGTGCLQAECSVSPSRAITEPQALRDPLPRSPISAKEPKATTIAVVSGSGGSGKSTIAAVLSLLSKNAGLSTAVLDADLQFGDMDYLLGVQEPIRIEDIAEDGGRLRNLAGQGAKERPALVAAPRRIETSEVVVSEIPRILETLKSMFDVVIVNTGAFWSDSQAMVLESADSVVFVMDARPSSLRATAHAMELCVRLGVATTGFTFVVNKHEKTSLLSAVDVACALHGVKASEAPYGGRDVDELLGAGYPEELIASKNSFVEAMADLLESLLPDKKREVVGRGRRTRKKRSFFLRGGRP